MVTQSNIYINIRSKPVALITLVDYCLKPFTYVLSSEIRGHFPNEPKWTGTDEIVVLWWPAVCVSAPDFSVPTPHFDFHEHRHLTTLVGIRKWFIVERNTPSLVRNSSLLNRKLMMIMMMKRGWISLSPYAAAADDGGVLLKVGCSKLPECRTYCGGDVERNGTERTVCQQSYSIVLSPQYASRARSGWVQRCGSILLNALLSWLQALAL